MIITGSPEHMFGGWTDTLAHAIASPVVFVADVGKDIALPVIGAAGSIAGATAGVVKGTVTTLHPNVQAPPAPSNMPLVLGIGGAALLLLVVAFSGRRSQAEHAA